MMAFTGFRRKNTFFYFLISFLFGFSHFYNSFSLKGKLPARDTDITVLNFNTRVFNTYEHLRDKEHKLPKNEIKWAAEYEADIKCFQEFYNDKTSKIYNTTRKIGKDKKYYSYVHSTLKNRIGAEFGMAIFSKHKIINKGVIDLMKRSNNDVIYADIKIKKDTIRVYNAHLQSLSIENQEIESVYSDNPDRKNIVRIFNRLKNGFTERSKQVDLLYEHIEKCPYPVIVCGDLNDTPYSYTYYKLNSLLDNSFINAGFGFGFTHNGKIPFLRIDNQFYSEQFEAKNFKVGKNITFSDHYPIVCSYTLQADN